MFIVLFFTSQTSADGVVCGIDTISGNGLNQLSNVNCPIEKPGPCDEQACCKQGKSPTGSIVAMVCCELKCGESTGGEQLSIVSRTIAPAPSTVSIRRISLDLLGEAKASRAGISLRSEENNFLNHDPPDRFLQNSAFLI
jgi:hypothetical protein